MRTKKYTTEKRVANFNLSISDLMAALCALLALLTIVFTIQLKETQEKLREKTSGYTTMREELTRALHKEFDRNLAEWDAEITDDGIIKFNKSEVLFAPEKANLKPQYKNILSDFFPRLIILLEQPKFKDEIEEIRIEGHTAVDQFMEKNEDYITGMELSQQRTTNVMLFCLNVVPEDREWVQHHIAAIGYSNSRPIKDENGLANKDASRRVEFKISTKADAVLKSLAEEFKQ